MKTKLALLSIYFISLCVTISAQIGTPSLSSPASGSTIYAGVTFNFTWTAASGASSYEFEFDAGQSYYYLTPVSGTSMPWIHQDVGIGPHTWHVRGKNGTTVGPWSSSRSYTVVGVPTIPSLSSPGSSASLVYGVSTTFSWGASSNAVSYQIQFDSDAAIAVSGTSYSKAFTTLGAHSWKVQAINPAGVSGWSSARSFTVSLGTPSLSAPSNNSSQYVGISFNFSWSAVSGATSYEFEFDAGQSYYYLTPVSGTSMPWIHQDVGIGPHTWHVRGKNGTTVGPWSSSRSYTVVGVPAIPSLSSPGSNGSIDYGVPTTFSWNASSNAVSYQIQFDSEAAIAVSGTSYSKAFTNLGAHSWKVLAINPAGSSGWSSTRSFNVSLGAPTPLTPVDYSTQTIGTYTNFSWLPVSGATSYDFEFDAGQSYYYLTPVSGTSMSWLVPSSAVGSHTWHVRATNGTIIGPWSSTFHYTVPSLTGALSVTIRNLDGSSTPLPAANGRAVLYDATYQSIVKQSTTNSSGVATLSDVNYGTYNLEVYNNTTAPLTIFGEEFWGSVAVNHNSISTPVSITRNRPFSDYYKVYINATNQDVTGGSVPAGTPLRIEVKVKNPGTAGMNVKARLVFDRDKAETYDLNQTSGMVPVDAKSGTTNGEVIIAFNYTPTGLGDYYGIVGTLTNTTGSIYSVTDGWSWGSAKWVTITSNLGNIAITVKNLDGTSTPLPAANGRAVLYDATFQSIVKQSTTNSSGVATLSDVNYGTYNLEVYNNTSTPLTIFGEEFWGAVAVNHNSISTPVSITRNRPFSDYYKVYINATNQDVTGGSVPAGTPLRIEVKVKNPGTAGMNVKARLVFDRDKAETYDLNQTSGMAPVDAKSGTTNGEVIIAFNYTPTGLGDYYGIVGTLTNTSGSIYSVTDGWNWGTTKWISVVSSGSGSLTLNIKNIDGSYFPVPYTEGRVKLFNYLGIQIGEEQPTDNHGTVSFYNIPVGSGYYYEVYHEPSTVIGMTPFGREYWGNRAGLTITNSLTTESFIRNKPYGGEIHVYNGSYEVTGKTVLVGTNLTIRHSIHNPTANSQNAKSEIRLDRDKTWPYDHSVKGSQLIAIPGNSYSEQSMTFTAATAGIYYASGGVDISTNSSALYTDGGPWGTNPILKVTESLADGVVNYYALLVGSCSNSDPSSLKNLVTNDVSKLKETLIIHGSNWSQINIKTLVTTEVNQSSIRNAIASFEGKIDGDDVFLFYYVGHGSKYGLYLYSNEDYLPSELDDDLNALLPPSTKIGVLLNSCYSGVFTNYFSSIGKLNIGIISSSNSEEETPPYFFKVPIWETTLFGYNICTSIEGNGDADGNHAVSINETYDYVYPRTQIGCFNPLDMVFIHPQKYFAEGMSNLPITMESVPSINLPTLALNSPITDITVSVGQNVNIEWGDSDADDNAMISLAYDPDLVETPWTIGQHIWLAGDALMIPEDPDGLGDRYVWNTSGTPPGTYTIWAMIYDGHSAPQFSRALGKVTIVGNTLPSILYNSQSGSWVNSNNSLDIDFSGNFGLNNIFYQIDSNNDSNPLNWHSLTSDGVSTVAGSLNSNETKLTTDWKISNNDWNNLSINNQNGGRHYLYFKITDDIGNIYITPNQASAFEFGKDNVPPSISFNFPNDGSTISTNKVDISWYSDDLMAGLLLSGLDAIYIALDQSINYTQLNETARTYTFNNLSNGEHTIYLKAKDKAGNFSSVKQIAFTSSSVFVIPTLYTGSVSSITLTSAISSGNIISDGGSPITTRGLCWSTSANPSISNQKTSDGTGNGIFTSDISELAPGTLYHIRAYATNSMGTGYGSDVSFTTNIIITVPTIATSAVTDITTISAKSGGSITCDGGASVTSSGVCWDLSANPTIAVGTKTTDGSGSITFTSNIDGLAPGTTYHVRAYATNSAGTSYGVDIPFNTSPNIFVPTVTTPSVSDISSSAALLGVNVTDDGGSFVIAKGVCWGFTSNPTIELNSKTLDGSGVGTFLSSISGLIAGTIYHVRAYATNIVGTSYSTDISFTTNSTVVVPTISTTTIFAILSNSATSGGNIVSDGGSNITSKGVCWSLTANPTIVLDTKTNDGMGSGAFTSSITGLISGTLFHVRAYATNSAGTGYGSDLTFTSLINVSPPTVITSTTSANNPNEVLSGGNVTSDGGAPVLVKGVCWSISPSPTISNSKTTDGTGLGIFTSSITGLNPSTTYHLRAYATNSAGTAYGIEITFTTNTAVVIPTLTTTAISVITLTSASSGGNIISNGGGSVTSRGVCWSTVANPTIALSTKTTDGTGSGVFTSSITGLTAGTSYHVRAYATNSAGTAYGADVSFTTSEDNQNLGEDDYVLNEIMTDLKIVEKIIPGTMTLTIDQASMLSANYNSCTKIGDYVVYSKTAQSLDPTDWSCESNTCFTGDKLPVNLQFKFAWKSDGTVYIGAVGTDNEILAAIADGSHWTSGGYKGKRTFFEGFALQTELTNMKNSSLVTGIPHVDSLNTANFFNKMTSKIFNRFTKPIYRIFSSVVLLSSPNTVIYDDWKDWCPYPGVTTGTGKRSFSLTFLNNTNSYVCATAANDNSNSSYVKIDGSIVAQKSKFSDHYYRRTGIYPTSVEIGTTIAWSSGVPRFSMAVVCDNVTSSDLSQTPSGGLSKNHPPIIISIPVYENITTGLEEAKNSEISVYPNPVSGILNIEYQSDDFKTINIFNSSGRLIGKEKAISPRQQLDFTKYEYGLYILEFVKSSGEKKRVKVINH